MKSVIYETKGRAREFSELALNHYQGCGHGCVYCYGPDVTHSDPEEFKHHPRQRVTADEVEESAWAYQKAGETRPVLLSFVTDPYQPLDVELKFTREVIEILHRHNLRVTILTKGGKRSLRDFDLLEPGDAYATTLTLLDADESRIWEPLAAPPDERIETLRIARAMGIPTWVSLEPVIYPADTFELIERTHTFVSHYKVGKMNYHPRNLEIDWQSFAREVIDILERFQCTYYIKKDLAWYLGKDKGFWRGRIGE